MLLIFIFVPLLGSFLSILTGLFNSKYPRYVALFSMFICLLGSLFCIYYHYKNHDLNSEIFPFMAVYYKAWLPYYGISFYLGLDKLSWCMIFLTSVLGLLAVFCEWDNVYDKSEIFYFLLLCMMSGIFGIFLSLDMLLFFLFWEMILLPMYFLIIFWGKSCFDCSNNIFVAHKFFVYSQLSGLVLLFSILNLSRIYYNFSGIWTFNYFFLKNVSCSFYTEVFLMLGFLVSFIIKMPLVPFHSWLPDTQACLSTSGSIDLIGVVLKPAIYGLLRFCLILFPRAFNSFSFFFVTLGLFSAFYSYIVAFSQTNLKRLMSYSSIASMGIIFSALSSKNIFAYQGSFLYLFSYIISTTALLILIGKIFHYTGTQNILKMKGLWSCMRFIPSFFLFFSFANLNIPFTGNFSGELMMFFGIFSSFPVLGSFFVATLLLSSIYSVIVIQRMFYGISDYKGIIGELNIFDLITLSFFVFCILFLGLYPKIFLDFWHEIPKKLF